MEKQANIDLKISGVRGGCPKWDDNKGSVDVFIDTNDNLINVDAFEGYGETYKRRDKCLIRISINGNIFEGTVDELEKQLLK